MNESRPRSLICIIASLSTQLAPLFSQYAIKGTVVEHNDKPMIRSDIFLVSNEPRLPRYINRSYQVDSDGSFAINIERPGLHRDWNKDFKELYNRIKTETDPFLRKGWIILRIKVAMSDAWAKLEMDLSRELAQLALEEIAPDSPLWSYYLNTMNAMTDTSEK